MKKTVLISGGSRGIGAACVRLFASRGFYTAFIYNKSAEAAKTLSAETGALMLKADVSSEDEVFSALRPFLADHSPDVLVNCAGISQFALFTDLTGGDWRRMIDTDLTGVFNCARAVLPSMIHKKSGAIVNIASMWGEVGASCETHYSAAKAGVIGLTKALAKEVGPSGIRVNCVSPGVIDTEMNSALTPDDLRALCDETPLGRLGSADEVAKAVYFLASDDASFITGQVLGVSGGFVV